MGSLLAMFEQIQGMREASVDKIQAISEVVGKHINEQWQKILIEVRINTPILFKEIDSIIQQRLAAGWQKIFIERSKERVDKKDIDPVVLRQLMSVL